MVAASLKKYLADGGTLIADAAGMSSEFRTSFAALMAEVTGKADALPPIPSTKRQAAPIVDDSGEGVDATEVSYRRSYLLGVAKGTSPRLLGVEMNGRYAVIYSEADITSGLLGTNTWGILGYSPESAQELGAEYSRCMGRITRRGKMGCRCRMLRRRINERNAGLGKKRLVNH